MSTAKVQASGSIFQSGRSRDSRWRRPLQRLALASGVALYTAAALAGPQGGRVTHGDGQINRAGNGTTVINQHTQRMAIDWESFNIGANERVVFQQPNSSSTALNRIFDQNPSQIFGAIDANGRILLLNPNGILFGESARINLQSLVATSLDLSMEDFKAGNYNLQALADARGGAIINRGLIKAATGGSVSLVGDSVANEGLIVADYGQINLASGRQATLDFDGDGMLLFAVDAPVVENAEGVDVAVANSGELRADGGQILLAGNTARNVFASVVNNEGTVRAMRVDDTGGVIRLTGNNGSVLNSGVVDASSRTGVAGRVEITGERVGLLDGSLVTASGRHGGGTVLVGGDKLGQNPDVQNASVTYVDEGARVEANGRVSGDGGRVIVFAEGTAGIYGDLSVRGGAMGGDGGFIETSGKRYIDVSRAPDISAENGAGGTWLIDPFDIRIVAGTNAAEFDETVVGDDRTYDPTADTAPGTTSDLGVDIIAAALSLGTGGTVEVTTGVDGPDAGDITWTSAALLDYHSRSTSADPDTLVLDAANDIVFEGNADDALISDGTGGDGDLLNLTLTAGGNVTFQSDATIDLNTGVLDITFGSDPAIAAGAAGRALTVAGNLTSSAASVATGGIGNDAFVFDASFAGQANGSGGADTFALNAGSVGVVNGGAGTDQITLGGGSAGSIAGGSGTGDEIVAAVAGSDFVVTGSADAGTVDGVSFVGVENLTGRAGVDTFTLSAALSGTADGAGGDDEFTLSGGSADDIVGGGGTGDTLIGTVGGSDFVVSGADTGTVDATQSFSGIENLTGRTGVDTFDLSAALTGTADGGGGNDEFTLNGGSADDIVGGDGTGDTLIGTVGGSDFVVSGANTGTVDTTQSFSGVENLTGRAGVDAFTLSAALSGTADGAGGDDTFTIDGGSAGTIDGGAGSGDEIIGGAAGNAFVVTGGADAGTVNGDSFANVENLTGGAGVDTFEFVSALSGTADGAGGNDEFTLSGGSADDIVGGGGTGDTLIGTLGGSDFVVSGADTGTVDATQSFSGIENLTGRTGVDTFDLSAALTGTADGGGGNDEFTLNGGSADDIVGGDGTGDTLIGTVGGSDFVVSGANTGTVDTTQSFSGVENLTGRAGVDAFTLSAALSGTADGAGGDDTFTLNGGSAGTIDGGAGSGDEIVGGAAGNAFVVTGGADAGTVNGDSFANVENLTGGAGVDTFEFVSALSGTADGAGGNDEFTLSGGSADDIVGGGGTGDTLIGTVGGSDFVVSGADTGTVDATQSFSGIENLTGRTGVDTFDLSAALTGTADGGGGNDEFTLNGGSADDIVGGGGTGDTLIGTVGGSDFVVSGANTGTVDTTQSFSGVENLTGRAGVDAFTLSAALSGTADGGDGDDTFTLNGGSAGTIDGGAGSGDEIVGGAGGNAFVVTGGADAGTVNGDSFANVENLTGGAGVDTFLLQAVLSGDIDAGAGDDEVDLGTGSANAIDGGADSDTLRGPNQDLTWRVDSDDVLTVPAGLAAGGVTNFEEFAGGAGSDTFIINANYTGDLSGGGGDDIFTLNLGTVSGTLFGDAGDDTFDLNGGSATTVDGGGDSDTLIGNDILNSWLVNAPDAGTLTPDGLGAIGFLNVENLTGGSLVDNFLLQAALTGTVSGAGGTDTLQAGNTSNAWSLTAVNEGTLNGASFTGIEQAIGGGADDTFTVDGGSVAALDGGGGSDTLVGDDTTANQFSVSAPDAGTLNITQSFSSIENLTGGALGDLFVINAALSGNIAGAGDADDFTINAGVGGNVSGDGGADVFDVGAVIAGILDAGTGDDSISLIGGSAANIVGGGGSDELIGDDIANAWTVSSADAGNVNGQTFDTIENLTGGTAVDTFALTAALSGTASGEGNDDTFTLAGGGSAGSISGGLGNDTLTGDDVINTWELIAANGGTLNGDAFTSVENIIGGSASDTFIVNGGSALTLDGGAGSDTLEGDDTANTFLVDMANSGSLNATQGFANVENLVGGSDDDTFNITEALSGNLDGGAGDDVFNVVSSVGGNVSGDAGNDAINVLASVGGNVSGGADNDTIDLSQAVTGSVAGDAGDDLIILTGGGAASYAGGTGNDTLIADAINNDWEVTGADNAGTLNTVAFTGIENLTGSTLIDTFLFETVLSGAAIGGDASDDTFTLAGGSAGSIDGGSGNDTLIGSDAGDAFVVTGFGDAGTVDGGAFESIESLVGGAGVDTFTFVTSLSGGATGGAGDDTFTFAGGVPASIDGGAGNDTLVADDTSNTFDVTAADTGTLNGTAFANVENLTGGALDDVFMINAAISGALSGEDGNDAFMIQASVGGDVSGGAGNDDFDVGGTVTGNVLGEAGMDTIAISGGTAALYNGGTDEDELIGGDIDNVWFVLASDAGTLNGVTFSNVENLTGGGLVDAFTLANALSGTAAGGAGDDTFLVVGAGAASSIAGGAGSDTLTGGDVDNMWMLTAAGGGTLNGGAFEGVESLVGGSAVDTFTLNGGSAASYDGAGGDDDLLQGDDTANAFDVTAADAGTLNGNAFQNIENLSGGSMVDTFTLTADLSGDISGGDGDDQFSVGAAVGGDATGDAGNDLFTLLAGGSAMSLDGGADDDTFDVQVGMFATPLTGGDGNDEVTFANFADADLLVDLSDMVYASFDIESVTGNGQVDSTLLSGDGDDVWQLDEAGNGILVTPAGSSVAIAFADFGALDAGDGSDSLQGPDGVDQTWTVSSTGTLNVPFTILAEIAGIDQFVGGDGVDTFEIAFDYVGSLSGGDGDDVFNVTGDVTGTLSGNGGSDTFNLLGGSASEIDGSGDGAGDSDTLVGADTVNTWTVTSLDAGDVNGQTFSQIENLVGGAVMDTFNLGAAVSGTVAGGAGNDTFLLDSDTAVTVGGIEGGDDDDMLVTTVVAGDRDVAFDGGAGNDSVMLDGGGAGYTGTYDDAAGTLAYTSPVPTVQTFTLSNVETVFDEVVADTLTVDAGSQMTVDLSLGTTSGTDPLLADLGIVLDFSNKPNLDLDAPGSSLTLTGPVAIGGTLDLEAGTLASDGGTISASDLIIRNAMVMSALNTAITTLTLDGVSGMFALTDAGDLDLLASTAGGEVTIEADGAVNVGAGETVASTGSLTLRSTGGAVTADGTVSAVDLALDGASGLTIDGSLIGTDSVTLTSGGTIDQGTGGRIATAALTATSAGGLTLAGTDNAMAAVNATNTDGSMVIANASASSMNLSNAGGALTVDNTGNLTLTGLSNSGGPTNVDATRALALNGDIASTGGATMTLSGRDVTQSGDVSAGGDIVIDGRTYAGNASATTTSSNGDVTIAGANNITVNDVSALNGSVVLSSENGDIFAARPGAEIRSENVTFLNLRQVGQAETPFAVFGLDGILNLDTQNNSNPGIQLFINQFGKFTTIGPRAGNAVDQRAQAASAVFGQGLSATLSTGSDVDSSVFAEDLQVIGKVGRGVAIPCDQVEDEEEACQ